MPIIHFRQVGSIHSLAVSLNYLIWFLLTFGRLAKAIFTLKALKFVFTESCLKIMLVCLRQFPKKRHKIVFNCCSVFKIVIYNNFLFLWWPLKLKNPLLVLLTYWIWDVTNDFVTVKTIILLQVLSYWASFSSPIPVSSAIKLLLFFLSDHSFPVSPPSASGPHPSTVYSFCILLGSLLSDLFVCMFLFV